MESVRLNNTLQEAWVVHPDSTSQWSHCPIVPLYVLYMSIVGICPLVPGFRRYEVVPQLEDIERLDLGAHTVKGTLKFSSTGRKGNRTIVLSTPSDAEGEFAVDPREEISLRRLSGTGPFGRRRYRLPPGEITTLRLHYT